jgi:hypothetical protein
VLVSLGDADFCAAAERLGEPVRLVAAEALEDAALEGAWLLHLPGQILTLDAARAAADTARRADVMVAVDLTGEAPQGDGAALAFQLAKLQPEILIAGPDSAAVLGVPLEGLARLPVLLLGDRGCEIFGRRVPAPPGATANRAAFAAALCSAYLDGAMPVEAAGRAMVYAATVSAS